MKKLIISLTLTSLFSASVLAEKVAIVGGTMHTLSKQGSVTDKALLIDGERIKAIVDINAIPKDYRQIDAADKVVTPGLIGAQTQLGLEEVGSWAGTVDASVSPSDYSPYGAALDVSYALNPASSLIPVARIEGVTSAATSINYTHAMFKGQGAILSLGEGDNLVRPQAFTRIDVSNNGADDASGSRAALWPVLENALAEVEARNGRKLALSAEYHGQLNPADINALLAVVAGDEPLLIGAHRVADIKQVIALKQRHPKLNVVLLYATEGWMLAKEIAVANIPVILNPESNLPYSFDQLAATMANAGRLADAGVMVSIGVETHNIRLMTQHAGNAVANGLSWIDGLAALTINTAKIYGIDNDYGSLEAGKVADVVIWNGDPLEVMNAPENVIIHGKQIDMVSRQTKLRDRYLNRDAKLPVQFQH
ncbi:amidohydrolase family protein [Neptunicella marina]|uniref:Amidohydrolase family protein n=1 Tax=Neptunicella marina TaxID=2125989 RepID=A0A8J6IQ50_9ALTE|nr:amidohydrolase family protein [Neptunicella marina]MBC3764489.1 amidohydrolase family protein [Neptunicella marina]